MSNRMPASLIWAEIRQKALIHNIKALKKITGPAVKLAPCVKANAYGHGIVETAKIFSSRGVDMLCVNALFEAELLRNSGIKTPVYIMGYVMEKELPDAARLNCHIVVYNRKTVKILDEAGKKIKKRVSVHMKIETGNNRQGIAMEDAADFASYALRFPHIRLSGIATHFANIEDTQNPDYAQFQMRNFKWVLAELESRKIRIPLIHCANSAATILFPETHFTMVRPGIAAYGLWPSDMVKAVSIKKKRSLSLLPALAWKTRIAQIKKISAGAFVGYGCTHRMKRDGAIAILPVGYYDGYDRGFSNKAHVLIRGKRAPVRGRVCMNMIMAEVTDIPEAREEDTATLLGRDGREEITADHLAELAGTINYEITTRIREGIPRILRP